jgi:hypothetical protein
MALQDINPALFVVAAEGIAQRGKAKLDTLQVYFLQMVARRARQLSSDFWPRVTERETEYLNQTVLTAYQVGVIGEDHILARAIGITSRRVAEKDAEVDESLAQGLRRTLRPTTPGERAPEGTNGAAAIGGAELPTTPVQAAINDLSGYQLAMLRRDSLEAQRAWRRFEKGVATYNPRVIAFIKLAAINKTLSQLKDKLPDLEEILNEPGKDDAERLRSAIYHARGLGKLLKYQTKTVEESLTFLPDPDMLLRRRQQAAG